MQVNYQVWEWGIHSSSEVYVLKHVAEVDPTYVNYNTMKIKEMEINIKFELNVKFRVFGSFPLISNTYQFAVDLLTPKTLHFNFYRIHRSDICWMTAMYICKALYQQIHPHIHLDRNIFIGDKIIQIILTSTKLHKTVTKIPK